MSLTRLAAVSILSLATVGVLLPASHAAVPTCNGQDATIVGDDSGQKLFGTDGPDVVVLGSGDDTFVGKGGDDVICGGGGNDTFYPGDGNDTVLGEDGDDVLYEGAGDDTFAGGPGANEIRYTLYQLPPNEGLLVDLRRGESVTAHNFDHFSGVHRILGTPYGDAVIGSKYADEINVGHGDKDIVYGYGGNDRITSFSDWSIIDAGDGDDRLIYRSPKVSIRLGDGDDWIRYYPTTRTGGIAAGAGTDTLSFSWNTTGYVVDLADEFIASKYYSDRRQQLFSFEKVHGESGPDLLIGNDDPNGLDGGAGNDEVRGRGGDDHLIGGLGRDVGYGGAGDDVCTGFEVSSSC